MICWDLRVPVDLIFEEQLHGNDLEPAGTASAVVINHISDTGLAAEIMEASSAILVVRN